MLTFVLYDISDNKIRNKVADICLDYGLQRVQLSTFEGFLSNARRVELARRLREMLRGKEGEVQVITSCKMDRSGHLRISSRGIEKKKYQRAWGSLMYVVGGDDE